MKWYFFLIVQFLKIIVEVKTKASGKIYCFGDPVCILYTRCTFEYFTLAASERS